MEYINDGFTLPVPLNLIPTPLSIYYAMKACCKKYDKSKNAKSNLDSNIIEEISVNNASQVQQANFAHNSINNSKVKNCFFFIKKKAKYLFLSNKKKRLKILKIKPVKYFIQKKKIQMKVEN